MADEEARRRTEAEARREAEEARRRAEEEERLRKISESERPVVTKSLFCPHGNIVGRCPDCS
jgi:septal ring factor EnvC (AmiA/AmiB activator)